MKLLAGAFERWARAPLVLRVAAPLVCAAWIWWLSSRPAAPSLPGSWRPFLHNGGHVVAYATLATLLLFAVQDGRWRRPAIVAVVAAALYGVVDELHQGYVPRRMASVGDIVSDGCGAVLGVALTLWLWRDDRRARRWVLVMLPLALLSVLAETVGWTDLTLPTTGPR